MKIALIGAQGVGKSTLAKMLAEWGDGVIVPEVARDCPYPVDDGADFRTELWILTHAMLAEKEAALQNEKDGRPGRLLVADRSILDMHVYSTLVNRRHPDRVSDDELMMLVETIESWIHIHPYDHVFLLTVSPEIWKARDLDDGFRSVDFKWFQELTTRFKIAVELLPRTTKVHHLINDGGINDLYEKAVKCL